MYLRVETESDEGTKQPNTCRPNLGFSCFPTAEPAPENNIIFLLKSSCVIPKQDGKVSNLVRYLVHQDGKGGDEAELEGGEEAGGDGKPVDEVVDAVGRQIQVAEDPLLSHLHLVVVLLLVLVRELKYLLENEEGEDASEDPKPHHQQSCVTSAMVTECGQRLRE